MSANHQQKSHKMCKSPPKNLANKPIAKNLPELGSYEVLNTNCTMVGSNNLNLESKLTSSISYPNPQIKVCSKPMKSPDILLKKPQSPRAEFIHNSMVQNVNKFPNFNQLRSLQPSPTPNTSGFVQQTVRTSKATQQTTSFNNGLGMSPSPSAYSNPSPGSYPSAAVSPYNVQISSPANSVSSITSGAIKSPVPSPQNIRPPTPQPILPQAFSQLPTLGGQNLVQIIHAAPPNSGPTAYTNHSVLTQRTIIAPQSAPQQQLPSTPLLKIKPPQNILPKPPSGNLSNNVGGAGVGKAGGAQGGVQGPLQAAPGLQGAQGVGQGMGQIVLPGQQVSGPALLLNQVPLIMGSHQVPGSGGVQLILRPGTPTAGGAGGKLGGGPGGAPQLVLQPGAPSPGPQVILQQPGQRGGATHTQHLHQVPQQLVRVLTANGMLQSLNHLGGLNTLGPTYIMQQPQVQSLPTSQVQSLTQQAPNTVSKSHYIQSQSVVPGSVQQVPLGVEQLPPPKKKPKKKKKNKEPKMDLANIMKLSGIGDEDDVLFESDTSESAVSTDPTPTNPQPLKLPRPADSPHSQPGTDTNSLSTDFPKRIGNIHISALTQENVSNHKHTRTDSHLPDKQTFGHSQISVQQSLSDINAINQNLAQIGLINQNQTNFLTGNNQILSQINTNQQNFQNSSSENQNLANILQALNQGQNLQNFSLLNGSGLQNLTSVSQSTSIPGLTTFPTTSTCLPTSQYQKFPTVLPTMSIAQTLTSSDSILTGLAKSQPGGNFPQPSPKQTTSAANPLVQNITNAHFNIPNAIPNIQVQNFCGNNSNLILNQLNQGTNILTPNIPNFSGNITINNSLIPNTNLTLPSNLMPNFLPANLVQPTQEMNAGFGNNVQRTGGFKLALSEDGRLILQHDPTLNQDIQSQLLLQSIFGINLQGGNLVLTSVNNTPSLPPPPKPVTMSEALKKQQPQPLDHVQVHSTTKTTNIIQAAIPSVKIEPQVQPPQPQPQPQTQPPEPLANNVPQTGNTPPNNYSYIVNLTPDQLETLKRNGQLTVNGQTIFMHRPNVTNKDDRNVTKSPKGKAPKKNLKNNFENKNAKTVLQEHLNIKNQNLENSQQNILSNQTNKVSTSVQSVQTSLANQTIINSLQSPINKTFLQNHNINNQQIIISGQITSCTSTEPKQTLTDTIYPHNSQNIICIQPNSNKNLQTINKMNENQMLMSQKQNIIKQSPNGEQLIILEHKQNTHVKDPIKPEPDMIFSNSVSQNVPEPKSQMQFINGIDSSALNVEQFLTNLNINPTNLGQLISQKLSQELPSGIDHKIVNISPGPTAGHIVAKIDISSEGMQQILSSGGGSSGMENPPAATGGNTDVGNLVLPPLVSMGVKQEAGDVFNSGNGQIPSDISQPQPSLPSIQPQPSLATIQPQPLQLHLPQLHPAPPVPVQVQPPPQVIQSPVPVPVHSLPQVQPAQSQQQQMPALIIGGSVLGGGGAEGVAAATSGTVPAQAQDQSVPAPGGKVYQRVQTIQLTPQKQQLLKSVQLQIHALSARLQQKPGDGSTGGDQPDIHTALRHLFLEQQKILATGKVIPNITQPIATSVNNNTTCTMETIGTQSVPVTTASKTNGTFLTSLLQQPVVSHNQSQKVYYHHGNQIIAINPQLSTSFSSVSTSVSTAAPTSISLPSLAPAMSTTSSSSTQTISSPVAAIMPAIPNKLHNNIKKLVPIVQNLQNIPPNPIKLTPNLMQSQITTTNQMVEVQSEKEAQVMQLGGPVGPQQGPEILKVATLVQMSPSKRIMKPSFSKAQLIEQQLQTDQNGAMNPDITTPFSSKADAVKRLVRYHCYKQPVLSPKDLAKADEIFELTARHFIDKFRCMVTKYQALLLKESMREVQTSELMMIDRMFLAEEQQSFIKLQSDLKLQNELELCESPPEPGPAPTPLAPDPGFGSPPPFIKTEVTEGGSDRFEEDNATNADFNIKCGLNYFSDESCDSNNFQPEFDEFIGLSTSEKSQEKVKNSQKNPQMESYNTTKIIGNFEIEINNKGCGSQESFTKNFRQKVEKNENFTQKDEDYDEWLCIQRELGYFPENKSEGDHHHQRASESTSDHSNVHIGSPADMMKSGKMEKSGHKRSSSDRNCLESLKKYRVEKHNSKVKKTGSIIGEVKFEVRIEHKKVFPEQKQVKSEDCLPQKQMPLKRTQCFDGEVFSNSKRAKQMPPAAADHPLPPTAAAAAAAYIKQETEFPDDGGVLCETSDGRETFDRSIDEQVQSAIDSILNLQQITSMTEKTDSQPDANKSVLSKRDELFPGSSPEDTLDEAVKSILS